MQVLPPIQMLSICSKRSLGRTAMRRLETRQIQGVNAVSQESFTSNHKLYDEVRSGYPADAVKCAEAQRRGNRILEVAVGTGKFTSHLLDFLPATAQLTAVEPSPGMLETFRKKFPTLPAVQAASEKLPFEDSSFDTIYIAQAFHWFANRESLAELRRVLQPHGSLVMVWNFENLATMEPNGWQAKTAELMWSQDAGVPQYRHYEWVKAFQESSDLFEPIRERKYAYDAVIESPEFYWQYWASRSYITALSPEEQSKLKKQLFQILDDYGIHGSFTAKRGTHVVWTYPKLPEGENA